MASTSPLAVAARGKGTLRMVRRGLDIAARYGMSPHRMHERLQLVVELVAAAEGGGATLPVTAAAVRRHPDALVPYLDQGIEFAVHGYHHVDHLALGDDAQRVQVARARQVLDTAGLRPVGFRAPYLRTNAATLRAVADAGFDYDASPGVGLPLPAGTGTDAYERALTFYRARTDPVLPVLPWIEHGLVRIPYCLPDDESVVDRLGLDADEIHDLWVGLFRRARDRGELFTLGVHPERIGVCAAGVRGVLAAARSRRGEVWVARLDEIAAWWRRREAARIDLVPVGTDRWQVRVVAGPDVVALVRGASLPGTVTHPLAREDGWGATASHVFEVRTTAPPTVDTSPTGERARAATGPVIWLGRWPHGARAAVAVTGDIDALTFADYAYRFVGR